MILSLSCHFVGTKKKVTNIGCIFHTIPCKEETNMVCEYDDLQNLLALTSHDVFFEPAATTVGVVPQRYLMFIGLDPAIL